MHTSKHILPLTLAVVIGFVIGHRQSTTDELTTSLLTIRDSDGNARGYFGMQSEESIGFAIFDENRTDVFECLYLDGYFNMTMLANGSQISIGIGKDGTAQLALSRGGMASVKVDADGTAHVSVSREDALQGGAIHLRSYSDDSATLSIDAAAGREVTRMAVPRVQAPQGAR